jgi:energy-coupling factor transport system ATP-binding protein
MAAGLICKDPVFEITDFSYTYPGQSTPALKGISLQIGAGECLGLGGPSGCGKTTLLLALLGFLKKGPAGGVLRYLGSEAHARIGMVFQNAESQILSTTVEDEVSFGPNNLGFSEKEVRENAGQALGAVGLSGFEQRSVEELSAGEKQRLAIASVLSLKPSVLLLDEPTSQLDGPGKEKLVAILKKLKQKKYTILIADHDLSPFRSLADRFLFMNEGSLTEEISERFEIKGTPRDGPKKHLVNLDFACRPLVIQLVNICLSGRDGCPIFNQLVLKVRRGELVHIFGPNGSGKSTLLKCLVGFLQPDSGSVFITGINPPRPERLRGKVGVLLQDPVRQLFEDTVYQEVSFSLKKQGRPTPEIGLRTREALALCEISELEDRSPFSLSYGQQHRIALASALAPLPEVLLLDEPFSGLDLAQRIRLLDTLFAFGRCHQCAVLIASHDPLPDPAWADRSLFLKEGRLAEK